VILRLSMGLSLNRRLCWPAWPSRRRPDAGGEHPAARQLVADPVLRGHGPGNRPVRLSYSVDLGYRQEGAQEGGGQLAEFRTQVNKQRSTPSSVTLGYAITEWLRTSEHEDEMRIDLPLWGLDLRVGKTAMAARVVSA
jgi:hypothetical protein